jgi:hypothetical protein
VNAMIEGACLTVTRSVSDLCNVLKG